MIWRRSYLWQLILVAINCLLLVAIFHVWWGEEAAPLTRTAKGPEVPKAPLLRDQQGLEAFRVVSAKNLFSQDRSGPEASQAVAKQATLEGRTLLGIIIIGDDRAALIGGSGPASKSPPLGRGIRPGVPGAPPATGAGSEVQVVRQGEDWDGFKVVEISNESVILQSKDGKKTLNFPE